MEFIFKCANTNLSGLLVRNDFRNFLQSVALSASSDSSELRQIVYLNYLNCVNWKLYFSVTGLINLNNNFLPLQWNIFYQRDLVNRCFKIAFLHLLALSKFLLFFNPRYLKYLIPDERLVYILFICSINIYLYVKNCFNPFLANVSILYPLKTPENQRFFGVFRGYKIRTLAWNEFKETKWSLTLSWRRPLSYRNQSIDLQSKWMDWFLYDNGLRHERVKEKRLPVLFYKALV